MKGERPAPDRPERALPRLWRAGLCLLTFILPFKFGTFIASREQGNLPLHAVEWLVFTMWPSFLPPLLAGLALLAALFIYPPPPCHRPREWLLLPLLLMLFCGIPGLIHSSELDYALSWLMHVAGGAAFALAVWWGSGSDRKLLPALLNAVAAATLLLCLHGWYQHFWGLQENLQIMQETLGAHELTEQIVAKLRQTRCFGTFADPNVYAGHLLLTAPLLFAALWKWGGSVEPPGLTRAVLLTAGAILFAGALFWSGSRGAMVGLGGGVAVAVWLSPLPRRWRLLLLALGGALAIGALLAVTMLTGRDLLTASVRLEYYRVATRIYLRFPFCGAGLGEFFPWHMRLKPWMAEEARDAHSLFFSLLSQCGTAGGLTALLRVLFPLALVFGLFRRFFTADRPLLLAALAGWCAWLVHAQLQFNDLVPASAYLAGVCGFWCFTLPPAGGACLSRRWRLPLGALAMLLLATIALLPGEYHLQQADTRDAISPSALQWHLHRAERWLPWAPAPSRMLGDVAADTGDFALAVRAHRELVRRTPHRSSSHCRLVRSLLLAGETDEAARALETAALWYPGNQQVYFLQAVTRMLRSQPHLTPSQRVALLRRFLPWRGRLEVRAERVEIHLFPPEQNRLPLPDALLRYELLPALNAAGIRFADGRPLLFVAAE